MEQSLNRSCVAGRCRTFRRIRETPKRNRELGSSMLVASHQEKIAGWKRFGAPLPLAAPEFAKQANRRSAAPAIIY